MAWEVAREYMRDTTLHGFRYIAEAGGWLQRAAWVAVLVASFAVAAFLCASNLQEASENPFVTSTEYINVQEIPFPAVSVVPTNVHPWDNFLFQVLSRIEFDCSGKSRGKL